MFRAIKIRLKKKSQRLSKTICTKRPYVSFLDYVFVKVFRDRVFHASKARLKRMSKRLFKNDLYKETRCFLSGLFLFQSIRRSTVSCYQNSIEENVSTPSKKQFVLRDPVFPSWIMSLSKYFEIESFWLSKFD